MAAKLFTCIQIEMPYSWEVTPGSYALSGGAAGKPTHVLIVRQPAQAAQQVLVIAAEGIADEASARSWLASAQPAAAAEAAFAALNAAIFARRIATADPSAGELPPERAASVLAGWGSGEQLAQARLAESRPLGFGSDHPTGRLRKQQRNLGSDSRANSLDRHFSALMDGSTRYLLCEELALRARQDLSAGRLRLAAIELDRAYTAAIHELAQLSAFDAQAAVATGQAEPVASSPAIGLRQRGLTQRRAGALSSNRRRAEQAAVKSLRLSERLAQLQQRAGAVAACADSALSSGPTGGSGDETLLPAAACERQGQAPAAGPIEPEALAEALEALEALLRAYALLCIGALS